MIPVGILFGYSAFTYGSSKIIDRSGGFTVDPFAGMAVEVTTFNRMERLSAAKVSGEPRSGCMESRGQESMNVNSPVTTSVKESTASKMLPNDSSLGKASQNGRYEDQKVGLKSPMSLAQTNAYIKSIPETESDGTGSAKSMVLGRRFNDSPAIVPIKKRRVQMIEAVRSPSPSPSASTSPAPGSPSSQTFPSHTFASPLYISSPRGQSSSHCTTPSLMACSPNSLVIVRNQNHLVSNEMETSSKCDEEQEKQSIMRVKECQNVIESKSGNFSECYSEKANQRRSQSVTENIEDPSHLRSESGSRDDRLHWDLNMDMAAWNTNVDQDDAKNIECAGSPETSTSRASNYSGSYGEREKLHYLNAAMKERHEIKKQKPVESYNALRSQDCQQVDDCSGIQQETPPFTRQQGWEPKGVTCDVGYGSIGPASDFGKNYDILERKGLEEDIVKSCMSICRKQIKSDNAEDDNSGRGLFKSENNIKFEDNDDTIRRALEISDKQIKPDNAEDSIIECGMSESEMQISREGDEKDDIFERGLLRSEKHNTEYEILGRGFPELGKKIRSNGVIDDTIEKVVSESEKQGKSEDAGVWNDISEEPEGEEHVDYDDSDFRDVDEIGLNVDCRTPLMMQTEGYSNSESGKRTLPLADACADRDGTPSQASSLEGGVCNENHGKCTTSGRRRPTGWDQLPEGFDNPEEALKAAKEMAPRRGGRSTTWAASGGRGSNSSNRVGATPRDGSYPTRRVDGVYYGERRPDDKMNDRDRFNRIRRSADAFGAQNAGAARGQNLGRREGFSGRGRGSSGWSEGQGGAMNQWGQKRQFGGPTAGVHPARVGNGGGTGFILGHDGNNSTTLQKQRSMATGGGRGGMRPMGSRGSLLQAGRGGGKMDMDIGMHYSMRAGNRPNGMAGGGRGLGGMHDPRNGSSSASGCGLLDRYQTSIGGPLPHQSRRSESPRRSSSSSCSHRIDLHPHPHPHPHLKASNRMPSMRSEARIVKPRMSPSSYAPARSQYHQSPPPPSSRWMADKREGDGQRDRDTRRTSLSWSHAPQRTSPHVVHGSSLMDERDRQVLAVTRQSPMSSKGASESSCLDSTRQQSSRRGEEGEDEQQQQQQQEEEERRRRFGPKDLEMHPSPRDDKDRYKANSYRRDRDRDMAVDIDDHRRRDSHKLLNKDERLMSGDRHAIGRDTDDEIAPRRRRHS